MFHLDLSAPNTFTVALPEDVAEALRSIIDLHKEITIEELIAESVSISAGSMEDGEFVQAWIKNARAL